MSKFFQILAMEACSITCAVFAGLLALNDKNGWGWFLLVAIIVSVSVFKEQPKG